MPIDEVEMQSSLPASMILDDRRCIKCNYSLKGLRSEGVCPECGAKFKRLSSRLSASDDLTHAPVSWLRAFAASAQCALAGYVGLAVLWVVAAFTGGRLAWALLFLPAMLLVWGVLGLTRPRPIMPSTRIPPGQEWAKRRLAARTLSLGWLVGIGAFLLMGWVTNNTQSNALNLMGSLGLMLGVGGLSLLFVYLSSIAHWANDVTLTFSLRSGAWFVLAGGVCFALMKGVAAIGIGVVEGIVILAASLICLASVGSTLLSLWRVSSLADWALINHMTDQARTDRLRDKAHRARAIASRDSVAAAAALPPRTKPHTSQAKSATSVTSGQIAPRAAQVLSEQPSDGLSVADENDGLYRLAPDE